MPSDIQTILQGIRKLSDCGRTIRLMEVCGTHTMAIARSGIKTLLPANIKLLSGPGCPVCVTPPEVIDQILELAMDPKVTITTYGDMVRVPGSTPGDNLQRRKALGADVRIVYSPVDAVGIAEANPGREVVFLGVGFETTAPGTAAAALTAYDRGLQNFTVFPMLKLVEPALRTLIRQPDFAVDGFICPGHVGTIIGEKGFRFLADDYGIPGVITGFEPEDILLAIFLLVKQIVTGSPKLQNEYTRAVAPDGNELAVKLMTDVFRPTDAGWRGLEIIPDSGLTFREEYSGLDAVRKFGIDPLPEAKPTACRCGDVITGRIAPQQCPLFGGRCLPEDPVGPCMVSGEGACAAAYKYQVIE